MKKNFKLFSGFLLAVLFVTAVSGCVTLKALDGALRYYQVPDNDFEISERQSGYICIINIIEPNNGKKIPINEVYAELKSVIIRYNDRAYTMYVKRYVRDQNFFTQLRLALFGLTADDNTAINKEYSKFQEVLREKSSALIFHKCLL